jgi:hypothetical protein
MTTEKTFNALVMDNNAGEYRTGIIRAASWDEAVAKAEARNFEILEMEELED